MKTNADRLSDSELKDKIKATWKRHAALKSEMMPLLSELRKRLREPGNHRGLGWAAWVIENERHIGICLKTANRWADEHEGKKPQVKSPEVGPRGTARPGEERTYQPPIFLVSAKEEQQLKRAEKILGIEEVKRLMMETLLAAIAKKRPGNAKSFKAHA